MVHYVLFISFILCITLNGIETLKIGVNSRACAACLVFTKETVDALDSVDPNKMVEVGRSFRIDPQGNQKLEKVPLSRSENHISEVVETVCTKAKLYSLIENNSIALYGKNHNSDEKYRDRIYLKMQKEYGYRENVKVGPKLMSLCENMVEDYEDGIVNLLTQEDYSFIYSQICHQLTELCTSKEVREYLTARKDFKDTYDAVRQVLVEEDKDEL